MIMRRDEKMIARKQMIMQRDERIIAREQQLVLIYKR
jgi:hypothetical protein